MGLWAPSILFVLPIAAGILYFIGYASVATLSAPLVAAAIFAYRYMIGAGPWEYILYGVLAEILLVWALRPNIKSLMDGTERVIQYSLHGRMLAEREAEKKPVE